MFSHRNSTFDVLMCIYLGRRYLVSGCNLEYLELPLILLPLRHSLSGCVPWNLPLGMVHLTRGLLQPGARLEAGGP